MKIIIIIVASIDFTIALEIVYLHTSIILRAFHVLVLFQIQYQFQTMLSTYKYIILFTSLLIINTNSNCNYFAQPTSMCCCTIPSSVTEY